MTKIRRIWLLPPLAFGRVGSGARPCQAFSWATPAIMPKGSAKTVLAPEDTIEVDDDGNPVLRPAADFDRIDLKDENGRFFPVCPFFELHGEWTENGVTAEGPISEELLGRAGLGLDRVRWSVAVANLKAYHNTLQDEDRVEARVEVVATDTRRHDLDGLSPPDAQGQRLVPGPDAVKLGQMQAIRPTAQLPGLRLRIHAPAGVVYAPTDIEARIAQDNVWRPLNVPAARRIINPQAPWATYRVPADAPPPLPGDPRVTPQGLAATFGPASQSLGLLDDVSDGLVTCLVGDLPPAHARIAIGPPDFSPATRPFVSLQDGLADRVERETARDAALSERELEELVTDIFERALETSDLINKDAQTGRSHLTNGRQLPPPSPDFEQPPIGTLWPTAIAAGDLATRVDALPVSFKGSRMHRRLNVLQYLKDRLRSDPTFVERWLRPPLDALAVYDRRMPALMRGSDGRPMHLTRRQYELVRRWADSFVAHEPT